jgi:hypothetical protein
MRCARGRSRMLKSLDDILAGTAEGIGKRWLAKVREATGNIKDLNTVSDEELLSVHATLMRKLARWLERSADKNELGTFFVTVAQEYCAQGVPLSELTFAIMLDRKEVTEHIAEGTVLEGAFQIYSLMETVNMVDDFYFLGMHYMTKGFLEKTFMRFRVGENIPVDVLRKYFPDDFFFKRE